jgi:hypothetical protein
MCRRPGARVRLDLDLDHRGGRYDDGPGDVVELRRHLVERGTDERRSDHEQRDDDDERRPDDEHGRVDDDRW